MLRLSLLSLLCAFAPALIAQVELPPQPEKPTGNPSDEQIEAYERAMSKWYRSLTDEQQEELDRREEEALERSRRLPLPEDGYEWEKIAIESGLSQTAIAHLQANGVLMGQRSAKQSFSIYNGAGPFFITSDSILNAYHVLLEYTFLQRELRMRGQLGDLLLELWVGVEEREKKAPAGREAEFIAGADYARRVLGPALVLLGKELPPCSDSISHDIEDIVERARKASGPHLPSWMGRPTEEFSTIDFRRFAPTGLYTRLPSLEDYCRALRWLQRAPFRVARDPEMMALGLLSETSMRSGAHHFIRSYGRILGNPQGLNLDDATYDFQNFSSGFRDGRDGYAFPRRMAGTSGEPLESITYTLLSTYSTPDHVLITRTTDPRRIGTDRVFPDGLEVAALLGSGWARERLAADVPQTVIEIVDQAVAWNRLAYRVDHEPNARNNRELSKHVYDLGKTAEASPFMQVDSLYADYCWALQALLEEPPSEQLPPLFHSGAWKAKSVQTALSGWSQMRHTLSGHLTIEAHYMGLVLTPPGFIEPNPEFFSRFAHHLERARILVEQGRSANSTLDELAMELRTAVDLIQRLELDTRALEGSWMRDELSEEERMALFNLPLDLVPDFGNPFEAKNSDYSKAARHFTTWAEKLENGEVPEPLSEIIRARSRSDKTRDRWEQLIIICRRLEALAHKQLRGLDWSAEEAQFIRSYGQKLAYVMLYDGNSWLTPRDDAPRITEILHRPRLGSSFYAGVGRPRELWVLYPWKGMDILCRGAVMPYYEFTTAERLDDDSWKAKLDKADSPPAIPAWLDPLLADGEEPPLPPSTQH